MFRRLNRHLTASLALASMLGAALIAAPAAAATPAPGDSGPARSASSPARGDAEPARGGVPPDSRDTLVRYAEDTWASFAAMVDEGSGLPTDKLFADGTRSVQTSTTNIGAYMWSALVAEELGIIGHGELVSRLDKTLTTLEGMERHEKSGQYFNWYDHRTGEKLTEWPPTGRKLVPILSSVDNGWLATALHLVAERVPELSGKAGGLFAGMDFGFYYRPGPNQILFSYKPSTGEAPCCYNTIVSESRIASYLGIAKGEIPQRHYYGAWRSFPATCDWSWQETRPVGYDRRYFGEDVFEGSYRYNGTRVTPGWGGSMFEALMPALFVPEGEWGPASWGPNHELTVRGQIHHGLQEAGYGYWGFSPSNVPSGGYRAYGVDGLGLNPEGYPSNNDRTLIDRGFEGCDGRAPKPDPEPADYTNGVVTPHAAFLGLRYAPEETLSNLARLKRDFDIYTKWGFRDSVNVDTGLVSGSYLALDQGMIMAAIGNALADDMLREAFVTPEFKAELRPPMAVEEFSARPRGCTITGTSGDDVLEGTPGDDVICGLRGDDAISGNGGADVVFGDVGEDTVSGGGGDDTLYGAGGDDTLRGGTGAEVLSSGPGDDVLTGGPGSDHHEGGTGDNRCVDASGEDTANACAG